MLPKKSFHIKIEKKGTAFSLYVDGIRVIHVLSQVLLQPTNIGIWAISKSKISFSNYHATISKGTVFVISQFGEEYDILYREVLKPICERQQLEVIRADEINASTPIMQDIIESIKTAALVIADVSPNNPNVFYEVGYAHALNKSTILLCDKKVREHLPFDLSGFRTIFYDNSIGGKRQVEQKLQGYLQKIFENR